MAATLLPPPEGGGAPPLDSPQAKAAVVNPGGRFLSHQEAFLAVPRAVSCRTKRRFSPHQEAFLAAPRAVSRRTKKRRLLQSVAVRCRPFSPVAQGASLLPDRRTANNRRQPAAHTKHRLSPHPEAPIIKFQIVTVRGNVFPASAKPRLLRRCHSIRQKVFR